MAARATSTKSSKKKTMKTTSTKTTKKKTASKSSGFWFNHRLQRRALIVASIFLFAGVGAYAIIQSGALEPDEVLLADKPDRGLIYDGKKVKTKGPCKDGFDLTTEEETKKNGKEFHICSHLDAGPKGVDIRERVKHVEADLAAMAAQDEKNKPLASDAPAENEPVTASTLTGSNMNGVYPRDWPCYGTGSDGKRIRLIYAYPSNQGNRLGSLRPSFNAIARRINQIFYVSGAESGNAHQARFLTNNGAAGCDLAIAAVEIPASATNNFSEITAAIRNHGYGNNDPNRRYLVWLDDAVSGKCGQGSIYGDTRPGLENYNNSITGLFGISWRNCWNYAEPHELMHNLGGVQPGAPYATAGYHCRDERDIMCYDDGTTLPMRTFCTRDNDFWRFDCHHDTYYRGNSPSSGYLSNHWNTANSGYLTP